MNDVILSQMCMSCEKSSGNLGEWEPVIYKIEVLIT